MLLLSSKRHLPRPFAQARIRIARRAHQPAVVIAIPDVRNSARRFNDLASQPAVFIAKCALIDLPAARLVFVVALLSPPVPAGLLRWACFRALFRLGIIVVGEWCVECKQGSSTNTLRAMHVPVKQFPGF